MSNLTARTVSIGFGVTFLVVGVLGFIPNPLVSPHGLFAVNAMHNWVHILTAGIFLSGALISQRVAQRTLQSVAVVYVGVAALGFFTASEYLLGLVRINEPDKWLHAALALFILSAAYVPRRIQAIATAR